MAKIIYGNKLLNFKYTSEQIANFLKKGSVPLYSIKTNLEEVSIEDFVFFEGRERSPIQINRIHAPAGTIILIPKEQLEKKDITIIPVYNGNPSYSGKPEEAINGIPSQIIDSEGENFGQKEQPFSFHTIKDEAGKELIEIEFPQEKQEEDQFELSLELDPNATLDVIIISPDGNELGCQFDNSINP